MDRFGEHAKPLVTRHAFDTRDTGEAEEFLRAGYAENSLTITGAQGDFSFAHSTVTAPRFSCNTLVLGVDFASDTVVRPNDPITVVEPLRGRLAHLDSDYPDAYTDTGDVVLAAPDSRIRVLCEGREMTLTQLHWPDVDAYATAMTGLRPGGLTFHSLTPITAGRARYWLRTVGHVRDVLADPWTADSPIVLDQSSWSLAAALLSTFPSTATDHATDPEAPSVRGDASAATLREVAGFIDAHADRPIGPTDITGLAGMPVAEIIEGFRRRHDRHPAELLWRARLRGVRRSLLDADPAVTVLAAAAARWGFTRLGRFRVAYVQAFGETPDQTLRR